MREPGRDFLDRAQAAVGDDGHLPLGGMAEWEVFPFERDGPLTDFADPEHDRCKTPERCKTCAFVANVVSRTHEPLDDLDDGQVELGRLIGRTYATVRALDGTGNVHVNNR